MPETKIVHSYDGAALRRPASRTRIAACCVFFLDAALAAFLDGAQV
jgi:hypothetical protein